MHDQNGHWSRHWAEIGLGASLLLAGLLWADTPRAQETPSTSTSVQEDDDRQGRRPRRLRDSLAVDPDGEWVPGQEATDRSAELARKLSMGEQALTAGALLVPPNANALEFFNEALAIDPGNLQALDGLDRTADALAVLAVDALGAGNLQQTGDLLAALADLRPDWPTLAQMRAELGRVQRVAILVARANRLLESGQLLAPAGENAAELYRQVLASSPGQRAAEAGLAAVRARVVAEIQTLTSQGALSPALTRTVVALQWWPLDPQLVDIRNRLEQERNEQWTRHLERLVSAIESENLAEAETLLGELLDSGYAGDTAPLLAQIAALQKMLSFQPGDRLQDDTPAGPAPRMVVVPRGTFTMGSPARERDRFEREGPQKEITFRRPFAISETEVTVAEFGRFADATGYLTQTERGGESSIYLVSAGEVAGSTDVNWRLDYRGEPAPGDLPVIHVSHADAQAYVEWLSAVTGHRYRLPSEAEFEYALRAGTQSRFWWGSGTPRRLLENLTGSRDKIRDWRWPDAFRGYDDGYWGPAPVASFAANPFGFFDLGGNVLEWTADCYTGSLAAIPADGGPAISAPCTMYSVRGGAWASSPAHSRSASRSGVAAVRASSLLGFRVRRAL